MNHRNESQQPPIFSGGWFHFMRYYFNRCVARVRTTLLEIRNKHAREKKVNLKKEWKEEQN